MQGLTIFHVLACVAFMLFGFWITSNCKPVAHSFFRSIRNARKNLAFLAFWRD